MDDNDSSELVPILNGGPRIDRQVVQEHLRRYTRLKTGYHGLVSFLVLVSLYFCVLGMQRNNAVIATENRALRLAVQRTIKPGITITNTEQYWAWFQKKFLPVIMSEPWNTTETKDGVEVVQTGFRMQMYNDVVGGITLTQQRRQGAKCNQNTMFTRSSAKKTGCLELDKMVSDEYYYLPKLNSSVPWDSDLQGYTVYFPTSANYSTLDGLVTTYKGGDLIDRATGVITAAVPVFNSNQNVLGVLEVVTTISLAGNYETRVETTSVPVDLYDTDVQKFRAALEIIVLILWLVFMAYFIKAVLREYTPGCEEWVQEPSFFRASRVGDPHTGSLNLSMPIISGILFLVSSGFWIALMVKYNHLKKELAFTDSDYVEFFNSEDFENNVLMASLFGKYVSPIWVQASGIHRLFRGYFLVSCCMVLCLMFRIFEYVDFQEKLNVIAATFRDIVSDLLHFFTMLAVVVTSFTFTAYLIFGAQVKHFMYFETAFYKMWQMVFGTYKFKDREMDAVEPFVADAFCFVFKIVVIILLLKMVIAIIFESYKNIKKGSKAAPSVVQDVSLLWFHFRDLCVCCRPKGYVPPHVMLEFLEDSEFENDETLGLKDLEAMLPHFGEFSADHANWALRKYSEESLKPHLLKAPKDEGEDKGKEDKDSKKKSNDTGDSLTLPKEDQKGAKDETVETDEKPSASPELLTALSSQLALLQEQIKSAQALSADQI